MPRAPAARRSVAALALLLAVLGPLVPAAGATGQATLLATPTALPLTDVAFRGDGLALVTGGAPGQGVVLRVQDGLATAAHQDTQRLLAVAWAPGGAEALVVGDGRVLRTTDGSAFAPVALPPALSDFDGRAVAWKPDGTQALVAGSALLRYWAANQSLDVVRHSADEAWGAVAWKPDGAVALVEQAQRQGQGWVTGRVLAFDGAALTHVATYGTGQGLVEGMAWAPSGAWALVWGHDAQAGRGPVMKWDGAALSPVFTKPADRFTALAWRPGGTMALLVGSSGERVAETEGSYYRALADPGLDLLGAAWHPSGSHALLVGVGGALLRWMPEGAPGVRLLAPLSGQVLAGVVEVAAQPEPRAGHAVSAVEARLDDGAWQAMLAPADPARPWTWVLDTTALADGAHTLAVRARDDAATGEPAAVGLRVLNQPLAAPRFVDAPARDDDGALTLQWTANGAERYELVRVGAGDARAILAMVPQPSAAVLLAQGTHALQVRGWLGAEASPWSAPLRLEVTGTASPFLAPTPEPEPGAASGSAGGSGRPGAATEDDRRAPGFEAVGLTAAAAAALALARRRRA